MVAGQFFHTGTPVVLWLDPGGYDAYRVERRFSAFDESSWETSKVVVKDLSSPNRYGLRKSGLTEDEIERVLQILSNLVGNAIKFTPEGGSIFIEAQDTGPFPVAVADAGKTAK